MLVKLADLVDTCIHCEGEQEHNESWHQLNNIWADEDLNAKFGIKEQIEILEGANRDSIQ